MNAAGWWSLPATSVFSMHFMLKTDLAMKPAA